MKAQRTIKTEARLSGRGLFGGKEVKIVFRPAEPDTGVVFVRTDFDPPVEIAVSPRNIISRERRSALGNGEVFIETSEHCLAAVSALGIDNLVIEMDAPELPGFDGSSDEYYRALQKCGTVEQDAPRRELVILIVLLSSMVLIFGSGFVWPVEMIPVPVSFVLQIFPVVPAIELLLGLNQLGAEFSDLLPLWRQLWLCVLLYGAAAWLLIGKRLRQ